MNIGLISVDSRLANIPLMKIAAYHRSLGDQVKWHDPLFDTPDRVYASKIFRFGPDYDGGFPACEVIRGGTGYDVQSKLPKEIENCEPDYSIYPDLNYSMQFCSRGCIRACPFCLVHEKEGNIYPVKPMKLNPHGEYIEVLDNNFFANPEWREAVEYLKATGQKVNLHGVDIRIIDEEQISALKKLRHLKRIHFAWDNPKDDLTDQFELLISKISAHKIMCYVLVGYWSTPQQDMYRIMKLKSMGISPFVMPWDKSDPYQQRLSIWCNRKEIFNSCKFENYK